MRLSPVIEGFILAIVLPITATAAEQVGDSGAATVDGSYIWVDLNGGNHYCPPDCGQNANNTGDKAAGARANLRVEANNQVRMRNEIAQMNDLLRNFRCLGNSAVYEVLADTRSERATFLDMVSFNRNAARINGAIPGGATLAGLMRQLADEQERTAGLILQISQVAEEYIAEMDRCGSGSRPPARSDAERATDQARLLEEERARRELEAEAERRAAVERERLALERSRTRIAGILDDLSTQVTADLDRRASEAVALTPATAPEPLEFVDVGTRLFSPGTGDSAPVPLAFIDPSEIVVDPLAARGVDSPNAVPFDSSFRTNILLDALKDGNQNWEFSIRILDDALVAETDPQKRQAIWDALNYTEGIYAYASLEENEAAFYESLPLPKLLFESEMDRIREEELSQLLRVRSIFRSQMLMDALTGDEWDAFLAGDFSLIPFPPGSRVAEDLRDEGRRSRLLDFESALGELRVTDDELGLWLTAPYFGMTPEELAIREELHSRLFAFERIDEDELADELFSDEEIIRSLDFGELFESEPGSEDALRLRDFMASSDLVQKVNESFQSFSDGDFESAFRSIEDAYRLSPGAFVLRESLGYLAGLSASANTQDQISGNSVFTDQQWEQISDMMVDEMIERLDIVDDPQAGGVR